MPDTLEKRGLVRSLVELARPIWTALTSSAEADLVQIGEVSTLPSVFDFLDEGGEQLRGFYEKRDPVDRDEIMRLWGDILDLNRKDPGFWKDAARRLSRYRRADHDVPMEAYLPLVELHCPAVKGCRVSSKLAVQRTEQISLNVQVLFNFIGGGRRFSCRGSLKHEVENGICETVFVRANLVFEKMFYPNNRAVKPIFVLKGIQDGPLKKVYLPWILGPHYCHQDIDTLNQHMSSVANAKDLLVDDPEHFFSRGVATEDYASSLGTSFRFGWSLAVPDPEQIGEKLASSKFEVVSELVTERHHQVVLAGGANYLFFRPQAGSASIQCTQTALNPDIVGD